MINRFIAFVCDRIIFPLWDNIVYRTLFTSPRIANTEETLSYICLNKCSVSRFGDGELEMCWRRTNLGFQRFDAHMSKRLREILCRPAEEHNHIVCIPYTYLDVSHLSAYPAAFWRKIKRRHSMTILPWLPRIQYYDTQCTRLYMDYALKEKCENMFQMWKKVWRDKNVVIIEGESSRLGVGNDLFDSAKTLRRILVPAKDAYSVYDKILRTAKAYCSCDDLILLAIGPTASILAYDLACLGFWAIDVGHIDIEYMWCQMGAHAKVAIPGRLMNEVTVQAEQSVEDDSYHESILCVVKTEDKDKV